ncbi:MAG: NADH-quinone oxidoreductase subunit NuoG [Pseudomonadota bacterium]
MSDEDLITLEVDGQPVQARKGQMLIEVTDAANAYVPRFCYHEKLSIAANCRMCLVQVERAPKPLPACATPVAEGMKVSTKSAYAISAQRATMEFLLINHPLDCPICDQGGECELQDLAMGYGRDVSRYTEKKRVVKDKNIGPLVSTDMTRCIHCTRCVRFGKEIQGIQELGTTGRGEHMQIGTYIEKNVDHELSGNIIDLCPVGALNNKPYRYSARSWEMLQQPMVGAHDCVGSNVFVHTLRGTIKRIVPRPNDAINETWIADRDRFAYEGIYAEDRLQTPKIRVNGEWQDTDWQTALERAATLLRDSGNDTGFIASPSATLEEGWLLQRLAAALGSNDIDHRLTRRDISDQDNDPVYPFLGMPIAQLDDLDSALVVGSRLRHEAPIIAHRLRKAAVDNAARISTIDDVDSDYFFTRDEAVTGALIAQLTAVATAVAEASDSTLEAATMRGLPKADVTDAHNAIAKALLDGKRSLVLLGVAAQSHAAFSKLRWLATQIASMTGATLGFLSPGANSAGLALAGVLPHRAGAGSGRSAAGKSAGEMLAAPGKAMLLWHVEPDLDLAAFGGVREALEKTSLVACSAYFDDALAACADVVLPIGTYAETAGTFVNVEGLAQTWQGVAMPVGEARPGWKVLRVLGNLLDVEGFDYTDAATLTGDALTAIDLSTPDNRAAADYSPGTVNGEDTAGNLIRTPIYEVDATVRRARALQLTRDGVEGRAQREGRT